MLTTFLNVLIFLFSFSGICIISLLMKKSENTGQILALIMLFIFLFIAFVIIYFKTH